MTNEELVDQIQHGIDPGNNIEQLYQQNYRLIFQIVRKYAYRDEMDDLLQEAYFGLYEAVKRYEDTAGVKFMSYATYWIRQAVQRYLENNGRCIRIPVAMQGNIRKYHRVMEAFLQELGRKPADRELCYYLNISKKALEEVKKAVCADRIQSLDEYLPGTEELELGDTVRDYSVDLENDIVDGMIERSKRAELWQIVKDNVTQEENTVITARFRRGLTLEQTGGQIGKSRDMARQIEGSALRKLRRSRITRHLEERFEVNYARGYRGSMSSFRNTGTSIVESIAIRNEEDMRRYGSV
ncbi:RNA polymerase primary sigma factor [Anaerotaenia torta]|uniref:sigma-70 family RNA polymerase sigma factor n=1 Tax=Anaerotaenia torta TaxID=433293 RepID=UPI003D23D487